MMGGPAQVQKHDTGPNVNHLRLTLGHRGPALVRLASGLGWSPIILLPWRRSTVVSSRAVAAPVRGAWRMAERSKYSTPQLILLYHHHEEVHHALEESLS